MTVSLINENVLHSYAYNIALNFIFVLVHEVGRNFWQPFVFLTYKVCGNIGTECRGKKIFSCTRYFIPKNKFWNAKRTVSKFCGLKFVAWFQRFRMHGKFIMKIWTWISSSLIFFRDSLKKKKLNSQISSFHYTSLRRLASIWTILSAILAILIFRKLAVLHINEPRAYLFMTRVSLLFQTLIFLQSFYL